MLTPRPYAQLAPIALAWAFVSSGCNETSPEPKPESPATAQAPTSQSFAQRLCLDEPPHGAPLDQEIRGLQRNVKRLPDRADGWVLLGRAWVRKARLTSDPGYYLYASQCAATALKIMPDSLGALELRALALLNDHEFAKASELAGEILARDAEDLIALAVLSDARLELGEVERAADVAQQMMDLRPDMATYSRASYFRWLVGDAERAKVLIRHALATGKDVRDPEPAAWSFVQAAEIFRQGGDYEGADAVYGEALRWVPEYPAALVGRARAALAMAQPRRAIEMLSSAYAIIALPETAWLLGDAREQAGDPAGAALEYGRVVEQGRKMDHLTLAAFYATKNRDIDEALRLITETRKGRGGLYVDDVHGWALYRARRIEEARVMSERAIRYGTKDARLLYHAGAIRLASGDSSGLQLIQEALALNPHFDATGAREARAIVASHDVVASARSGATTKGSNP